MAEGNGREWSSEIKELGDTIVGLKVSQVVELGDYLEEVHGIKAAAGAVAMVGAPAAGAAAGEAGGEAAEKTEFTVSLDNFGSQKIQVIKVIREITGLGLKEAKELVESAPKAVRENVSKEEAEKIKQKLEEVGATVSLK